MRLLCAFQANRSGVAAVEFALLLPIMLSLWIGMVVASDALTTDKKVTLLTRTLADMTTQMVAVSQSDLDSIFGATEATLWPHPADAMGMRVTSLDIDGSGQVFVDWSVVPSNALLKGSFTAKARCTKITTLPADLKVARTSLILAEVTMNYKASLASDIVDKMFYGSATSGVLPLGDQLYMRPRQAKKVAFNPAVATCAGYVS